MATTIGTVGSGLIDIDATVKALVANARAPKQTQLDNLETKSTTKLTALGSLKSAVSEFQSAMALLNSPTSFLARTATSSNTAALNATATASAVSGSYKINVTQLAAGSKIASAAFDTGATTAFNEGSLDIKVGGDKALTIAVDSTNNTLSGIRDAINKQGAEKGISATIVTDSQGSRLVLSSSKMGDGKDITMTGTSTSGSNTDLSKLNFPGPTLNPSDFGSTAEYDAAVAKAGKTLSTAQSAKLTVDGLNVVSDSNTVTTAIDGITLNLTAETEANKPLTLTVGQNSSAVKTNVQNFVTAYNKMVSTISSLTKVTPVEGSDPVVAALAGDSTARALLSSMRSELVTPSGDGSVKALASLGITTKQDGTLDLNAAKLDKAIATDYQGISDFFTGDNGLANRMTASAKPYTDSAGVIEQRSKVLRDTIKSVDKQQESLDLRMKSLQTRLYKQFTTLDTLLAQMQGTSDSLTSQLDALPGLTKKN
ncbi:flagellar filament capping protein FliD [Pseudomonas sp. TUM22785]|uniref:flagellar filament capping protein FliD n=1 Tax=Pseudomonas sp. TUM22785 TaxID=3019098 RepID=UPI00230579E7|nr:flagellar filament capping protein FliD [Pseudomonas sp. TUM22785]WCD82585.1 flagellar filament capping protein FliD [Pseudomonas sp. TUM22785]